MVRTYIPLQEQISQGTHAALAAGGYVKTDGSRDSVKLREAIYEVVRQAKAISLKESREKAITRGELVSAIFPSYAPQETSTENYDEDATVAEAVWAALNKMVWEQTIPNARGALQQLIGVNMGNGYVLCRTTKGKDKVGAVYVTDDVACIERDFITPDNLALKRKVENSVANRQMLIMRQPEHGKRYVTSYDRQMKSLSVTGHEQLTLAIEAVSNTNGASSADDAFAEADAEA